MTERDQSNARKLAGVLERYAEDPAALAKLAAALNYHAPQLREDIAALYAYIHGEREQIRAHEPECR